MAQTHPHGTTALISNAVKGHVCKVATVPIKVPGPSSQVATETKTVFIFMQSSKQMKTDLRVIEQFKMKGSFSN